MAIMKLKVLKFDNGEELELPQELHLDPTKLSRNPVLNVAQIFVRELQALGHKCSWRRSKRKIDKKEKKATEPDISALKSSAVKSKKGKEIPS